MAINDVLKAAEARRRFGSGVTYAGGQYTTNGKTFSSPEEVLAYQKQRTFEGDKQRGIEAGLKTYDEESGKFFDQMRQGFRQRTQSLSSAQQTGGMSALNQAAARKGIAFSGIQQAAESQLQGQIGAAQVQAESGYDQKLNELRQTQRDAFLQGRFAFFDEMQLLNQKYDLEKEFASFQAELADQYSSGWGDFFNVVGQGVGMWASGGFSGLGSIFGGGGGAATSGYGGTPYRAY